MIDTLPGRLFMGKDILKIRYGQYGQKGVQCFAISVFLRGSETPEVATYKAEPEMLRDLSLIEKAWKDAVQDLSATASILEEFQKMQQRLDDTERKLEEWRRRQEKETESTPKSKNSTSKKKTKEKTALTREDAATETESAELNERTKTALLEWIQYKYEKHQPYQKTGFKVLLTKLQNNTQKYGEEAVAELIGDCISSGYQGITWDRLKKPATGAPKKNQFTDFPQNEYTDAELEEIAGISKQ